MITGQFVWQPGEIAGTFVGQPGKLVSSNGETRVVALRNCGDVCFRAWNIS